MMSVWCLASPLHQQALMRVLLETSLPLLGFHATSFELQQCEQAADSAEEAQGLFQTSPSELSHQAPQLILGVCLCGHALYWTGRFLQDQSR